MANEPETELLEEENANELDENDIEDERWVQVEYFRKFFNELFDSPFHSIYFYLLFSFNIVEIVLHLN